MKPLTAPSKHFINNEKIGGIQCCLLVSTAACNILYFPARYMLQKCQEGGNVHLQRGMAFLNKHISLGALIPLGLFALGCACLCTKGYLFYYCSFLFSSASTSTPLHRCHCDAESHCTYIFPHRVPQHMPPLGFKCNTARILTGYLQCFCSQGHSKPISHSRLQLAFPMLPGLWAC